MKTKLLALILALAMLLTLLSACGSSGAATSAAASAEPEAAEETTGTENAEEPAEPAAGIENQTGSDLAAAAEAEYFEEEAEEAEFPIYGPFAEETITLTYWKVWPPFLEGYDPMDASIFSTFLEDLNVRLELTTVGTDSADTKFNLMVASGDYDDLIENACSSYSGGGSKAIEDEIVIDLMPYMQTYAPDYWQALQSDTIAMKNMITSEGQMAEFVSMYDDDPAPQSGLWIRTDWLSEQGLDKPSTLEDFENVLATFKDVYGCTDSFACRDTCEIPVRNVFGAFEWSVNENDEVVYGYTDTQDAMKDYLKTAHEWYENGYFSADFITANDTTSPKSDMLVNGKTGVFDADILIISEVAVLDDSIELEALAPITANADDKIPASWTTRMNSSNKISISTACEYPEEAVAYVNYAFTEDAFMAVNWGIEGETYTVEDGQPVFTDLMLNNPNGLAASFTPLAYISPGFPVLKSYEMTLSSYNMPAQQGCYEIFASKIDPDLKKTEYPKDFVNLTTEESESVAAYSGDIDTYVTECLAKFITGEMDVDADYDGFVSMLQTMGSDEIKRIYQDAYDRFIA